MNVETATLPDDLPAILALNNAAVPAVNALDEPALAALAAMGRLRVVREGDAILGFLLSMTQGAAYQSLNYRWFSGRFPRFRYVDRVVVAPGAQGRGIGRRLYEDALSMPATGPGERLCAEVNLDPPNPGSIAFHERLGFMAICARLNPEAGKTVAMMVREPANVPTAAAVA